MSLITSLLLALSGIAGIICMIFYRRLPSVFLRLGIFLLFAMVSQIVGIYLSGLYGSNFEFYNFVIAVNYLLYYSIFLQLSKDSFYRIRTHIVFTIGAGIIAYMLIRNFEVGFASRALSVVNIVVIIFCLLYLYQMLRAPLLKPAYQQGKFWVTTAFFIHHLSVFSFWLGFEFIPALANSNILFTVTYTVTILQYLIIILAIFIQLKFGADDRVKQQ